MCLSTASISGIASNCPIGTLAIGTWITNRGMLISSGGIRTIDCMVMRGHLVYSQSYGCLAAAARRRVSITGGKDKSILDLRPSAKAEHGTRGCCRSRDVKRAHGIYSFEQIHKCRDTVSSLFSFGRAVFSRCCAVGGICCRCFSFRCRVFGRCGNTRL